MRGANLNFMSVKQLHRTVVALNGGRGAMWNQTKCVKWLCQTHHIDEINVGNFIRLLLRVTVRVNEDGYKVGLSYAEMLKIVRAHFPHSAVKMNHFSYYATVMRSRGEMIPVYRQEQS